MNTRCEKCRAWNGPDHRCPPGTKRRLVLHPAEPGVYTNTEPLVMSAGESIEVVLAQAEDKVYADAAERWGAYEPDDGEAVAELQKVVHEKFREPMCGWPTDGRREP